MNDFYRHLKTHLQRSLHILIVMDAPIVTILSYLRRTSIINHLTLHYHHHLTPSPVILLSPNPTTIPSPVKIAPRLNWDSFKITCAQISKGILPTDSTYKQRKSKIQYWMPLNTVLDAANTHSPHSTPPQTLTVHPNTD